MQTVDFQLNSAPGIINYAVEWKLDEAKAVICLIHGLGEHCRRYDHMAKFYAGHGYAMLGIDHAGHGRTKGTKGHATIDGLYNGIRLLLNEASSRYPGKPIVLYGHSMGGNLVLNHLFRNKPKVNAVVVTGSWIKLGAEPPKFLEWMGRLLKTIAPSAGRASGLDAGLISRNKEVVNTYVNDPLVHDRISFGMGIELLDTGRWLDLYKGTVSIPLLMMHGAGDQITSPLGTKNLASRLTGDVTHKEWPVLYHEIHNEDEKGKVFDFTLKWMEERLG